MWAKMQARCLYHTTKVCGVTYFVSVTSAFLTDVVYAWTSIEV